MTKLTKQHIPGWFLFCILLALNTPVQAEFITDKIAVNIHADRFGQGAVLKTLSSGTTITVLINDGEYSRIRTNDNVTGWIETKYISNERPAQLDYLELLAKSKTLEAKLKAAEEKQTTQSASDTEGIDLAELEDLRKRAADAGWMRVELKKARDQTKELEDKLKAINKNSSSSNEELNNLREKNKSLEQRLAAAILVNEQQEAAGLEGETNPANQAMEEDGWTVKFEWFLGSIVVALIIGLIAGMTWLDKRIRQRHGGFRIY